MPQRVIPGQPPPSLASFAYSSMAIAPITGKLRKRLILDITAALGLGTAAGYGYWYGIHLPSVRHREEFYRKLALKAKEEA
ncbi:hypothetical protein RhiXN_04966 [Rhizoctonia solani]|uniref:Cytochrome c oxidase polypeptide VIIA n=1 Tax=Rhizoctonia solani TaxID=456999 RepID=A0A8H8STD4_9AGAM|nr:uncharacterized protein RhiXN_04966 [Rhizoctonia solani]QRW16964.1 hypothetical protein RhiXN_04966 [Rhizoctonia solani]